MKRQNDQLVKDVESLVEQSVAAEATEKVWDKFAQAMGKLDEASQDLLRQFFGGTGVEELSRQTRLSPAEVEAWLSKARKQLVENMRSGFQVRQ